MAKARKKVAKRGTVKSKAKSATKKRKTSARKAAARKTGTRQAAAKRPARKRRSKSIADTLASGLQVVADSFEESNEMQRRMGLRGGIGEG